MSRAAVALVLVACASTRDTPPPAQHDAAPTASAVLDEAPASPTPCERRQTALLVLDGSPVTVTVPLPCAPFDRLTDTPDPLP